MTRAAGSPDAQDPQYYEGYYYQTGTHRDSFRNGSLHFFGWILRVSDHFQAYTSKMRIPGSVPFLAGNQERSRQLSLAHVHSLPPCSIEQ